MPAVPAVIQCLRTEAVEDNWPLHPAIQAGTCGHTRPGACAGRKMLLPQEVQCAAARPVPQRLARAGEAACGACARRSGRVESLCLQA